MRRRALILITCLGLAASLWAGDFKLPKYQKATLKNGLVVYLMEQHEVPLIAVSAVFPAGSVEEGARYGLAAMTAEALLFGAGSRSKTEIEETLEALGASYGSGAGAESAELSASFLTKDTDTVLPILADIIQNPTFDSEAFDRAKQRRLQNLILAKDQPRRVIGSYFTAFLLGDHPYGHPGGGLTSTVEAVTVQDAQAFYKAHYTPQGSAIAVVGDFKASEMKKRLEKLLGGWTRSGVAPVAVPPVDVQFTRPRVLLVNKSDATETQFYIGGRGIKRSDPDYTAVQVVNTVLGGRFTSWLNDELRVNRGLTYGAQSFFMARRQGGLFLTASYTRTPKTEEALDVALEVLDRLHTQGIDAATLKSAQNYIKGQYPPDFETTGSLASLLTDMFIYGFDESYINDFQKNVDDLTVESVKEIVRKHFPNENLQFVLIGKADEIRDIAAKYGEVTEKEIQAEGF